MSENNMLIAAAAIAAGPISDYTKTVKRISEGAEVEVIEADPETWRAKVTEIALDLHMLSEPRSAFAKAMTTIEGAGDKENKRYKAFVGTVLRCEKERTTTRAVVTLLTGSDRESKDAINKGQNLPLGQEQIRSERTDEADGLAMAKRLSRLIGHKVMVYVDNEPKTDGSGQSVRVLRHVVDLGVDQALAEAA